MEQYIHHIKQLALPLVFLKMMENGIVAFLKQLEFKQAISYAIFLR
jgi:hypothetical protein